MRVEKTKFEGLIIIRPEVFSDDRGSFLESWTEKAYQEARIQEKLVQDNISISKKNVLRGLHYQKNQGQLVTVAHGEVFDVVVDIRSNSKTFGQYFSLVLSSDNPTQIYMPPGFAHGFCVLSDEAIVNYKCSQYYSPQDEGGIIWNDPTMGINWPIQNPIISEKDQNYKTIKEIF